MYQCDTELVLKLKCPTTLPHTILEGTLSSPTTLLITVCMTMKIPSNTRKGVVVSCGNDTLGTIDMLLANGLQ